MESVEDFLSPRDHQLTAAVRAMFVTVSTSARILPVRLDLIDLTYSVSKAGVQADSSSSSTPILSSVSASLRAGQLVAIMGPSGAHMLSSRETVGRREVHISVSDFAGTAACLRRCPRS